MLFSCSSSTTESRHHAMKCMELSSSATELREKSSNLVRRAAPSAGLPLPVPRAVPSLGLRISTRHKGRRGFRRSSQNLSKLCSVFHTLISSHTKVMEKHDEVMQRQAHAMSGILGLQKQLNVVTLQLKVSVLANENKYLQWENERFTKEVEGLKKVLDEAKRENTHLRATVADLQRDNHAIRTAAAASQPSKLNDKNEEEKREQTDEGKSENEVETLKRTLLDKEKEFEVCQARARNEVQFLGAEMRRKEGVCNKFAQMLNTLTNDNQLLFKEINNQRRLRELESERLHEEVDEAKREMKKAQDKEYALRRTLDNWGNAERRESDEPPGPARFAQIRQRMLISSRDDQLQMAHSTISQLQKQVKDLSGLEKLTGQPSLIAALGSKTLKVSELENTVSKLEEEIKNEKEQRENATALLVEMGRDMRKLLDEVSKKD